MKNNKNIWYALPACIVCTADQVFTLIGQSKSYWKYDRSKANEANDLFNYLLQKGPWLFEFGIIIWMVLFTFLVMKTPPKIAKMISLSLIIGHSWGLSSWLQYKIGLSYYSILITFIFIAILTILCWEISDKRNMDQEAEQES